MYAFLTLEMMSSRCLSSISVYKMASQISVPLISYVLCGRIPVSHPKNQFFHRKIGTCVVSECAHRCSYFDSQKIGLFSEAGIAKLQKNVTLFAERCFDCSSFCVKIRNVAVSGTLMHMDRKRYFSSTSVAQINGYAVILDANSAIDGQSVSRISRSGRIDAQNALFDYLHSTRSLNFTDAEHMSKNSPVFLQKLTAKLENEQDMGRSLSKFLCFNPINEFEPFFESLGLKPSEYHPLLPRNLIFLTDDGALLENYHVLCNYGVPRSKIGKMYREAMEIFRYDSGVLTLKLQAYEELGLSRPTIIKLVTCCPTLLIGDANVEFLCVVDKLKTFGIELDWLRGCLSDKSLYNWNRILEMLDFLDRMCCGKKELASLMRENPRFVFDDSGKKIYVLVAMLLKLGLSSKMILNLFVQYPRILAGKFTKYLLQSVQFLSEIGMENKDIARIISTHPQVFGTCTCRKSKVVLESSNVTAERLCEIIIEDPSQFSNLACRKKVTDANKPRVEGSYLQEKTNFLLKLGFVENSDEMAKALSKFRGRGDQLQERFDCLVNVGLDCHAVSEMVKLAPPLLNQSTDVIEKKINYLLNDLGYPLEALTAFPTFLCYNLEKIKLRFSMYRWLKKHGIVRPTKNRKIVNSKVALSTILACSDTRFLKYFVDLHPKGLQEWERLKKFSSDKMK
ncbi:Transcription termination factor mitochondrial/chloroplastic protein [Dioscorea alata]|uniref:Transcription termination factor mitochondrial/chloroplastic protein n=1 Tax=Dioscorea alata TaxID=55571 RepID=A0ACB7VIJ2_DIOAL|nr:Transcription termination factor mitochondrial/chloroplastic protein [Dioscorea alata]